MITNAHQRDGAIRLRTIVLHTKAKGFVNGVMNNSKIMDTTVIMVVIAWNVDAKEVAKEDMFETLSSKRF